MFKQVISSLRQEVLMSSLLQWDEEQQEVLLPGFGQRVFKVVAFFPAIRWGRSGKNAKEVAVFLKVWLYHK